MPTFLKPKLLKFSKNAPDEIRKQLPCETQCSMVSFFDNLVLLLALKWLKISLSLVFGFHFSNLLQLISKN